MNILLPVGKISKLFGFDGGVLVNLYDTFPDDINNEEPLFVRIDTLAVPLFTESFDRRGKRTAMVRFADIDNPVRAGELIGLELFMRSESKTGHFDSGLRSGSETGSPDIWLGRANLESKYGGGEREEGELYFDELIGYAAVISEQNAVAVRGTVAAFIDNEMNPLFRIEAGGKEILIPATEEFIEGIDTARREIILNIPEGLLNLNL